VSEESFDIIYGFLIPR